MPVPTTHPARSAAPRVVIIDADRRIQQSLADLLRVSGEIEVVGAAGDVRAALELVDRERPDAVLVDPRLPDVEAGSALVSGMASAWPQLRIVMTGWGDTEGHLAGRRTNLAYVTKGATPEAFTAAIVDACCPA